MIISVPFPVRLLPIFAAKEILEFFPLYSFIAQLYCTALLYSFCLPHVAEALDAAAM